ncbi:12768_t:CDS:2, partial [Gigaspora rosea]
IILNDYSFYALLHTHANDNQLKHHLMLNHVPQDINKIQVTEEPSINETQNAEEPSNLTTDCASFELFLETIKHDYKNCGPMLQIALEKFAKRYNAAKAKSIPALTSFLYDINRNVDPLTHVKSGSKI